jgi:hypothetical protein
VPCGRGRVGRECRRKGRKWPCGVQSFIQVIASALVRTHGTHEAKSIYTHRKFVRVRDKESVARHGGLSSPGVPRFPRPRKGVKHRPRPTSVSASLRLSYPHNCRRSGRFLWGDNFHGFASAIYTKISNWIPDYHNTDMFLNKHNPTTLSHATLGVLHSASLFFSEHQERSVRAQARYPPRWFCADSVL